MLDRIKKVLSEFTDCPVDKMTEDTDLVKDLGLNSLDIVNVAMAFEDEFDIEVPDRDIKELVTIRAIEEYLNEIIK